MQIFSGKKSFFLYFHPIMASERTITAGGVVRRLCHFILKMILKEEGF